MAKVEVVEAVAVDELHDFRCWLRGQSGYLGVQWDREMNYGNEVRRIRYLIPEMRWNELFCALSIHSALHTVRHEQASNFPICSLCK